MMQNDKVTNGECNSHTKNRTAKKICGRCNKANDKKGYRSDIHSIYQQKQKKQQCRVTPPLAVVMRTVRRSQSPIDKPTIKYKGEKENERSKRNKISGADNS